MDKFLDVKWQFIEDNPILNDHYVGFGLENMLNFGRHLIVDVCMCPQKFRF